MFKLNAKFDADSLVYSLSHLECNGHTVHMLTQWHTLPPWASTVNEVIVYTCASPWLPGYIDVVQTIFLLY